MDTLNDDLCYQALKTRDARFDGRFYTAVLTTGIFCRPICPAVTPKRRNVRFYPSAETALANGFRPCLRCRPEAAPGSPAAAGTHTTLARALKLIEEGALDSGSVSELAARLGISDRYLRKLYRQHTGLSPGQHAQARRLLRARQLIVDSNLSMTHIAEATGFGSLRHFNHTLKAAYGDAPTAVRRGRTLLSIGKRPGATDAFQPARDDLVLFLRARPPFEADTLLDFFRARAIPGLETVGTDFYARSISLGAAPGLMICHLSEDPPGVQVILRGIAQQSISNVIGRVHRLFDLDADLPAISSHLAADPLLQPLVARHPGLRVPGSWDPFELAIRAVIGQQISIMAARTVASRLISNYGARLPAESAAETGISYLFPLPHTLTGQTLTNIGLPRARSSTLAQVASGFADAGLFELDGPSLLQYLAAIPGIGPWTLNYLAIRALGDPDGFPASDLALLKASARVGGPTTATALTRHAERWRPWRAYAAQYLWTSLAIQAVPKENRS